MTAEGNGSSDEGPISKDWKSVRVKASRQPAAIFAIEDQSRLPPQPGEGTVLETAEGGEGSLAIRTADVWRAGALGVLGADWRGGRPGAPRRGEGAAAGGPTSARRLIRAAPASPPPPSRATLETDLGKPADARALSLSLFLPLDFFPDLFP